MQIIYRPRWSLAFFSGAVGAIMLAVVYCLLALVLGLPANATAVVAMAVSVAYLLFIMAKVRRRSLTVTEQGMIAQRDTFRATVNWADFIDAQPERIGGLYPVDVMTFSVGAVEPVDVKGRRRKAVSPRIQTIGADRRIQVGVYTSDWRAGPIGELVARHSSSGEGAE
ncbi:hypothetical protein [Streptosporangium sp. NBC_01756]|uniref:hypothetical protein n=1 Tax=Streptosporangium sp. NBC_01756 TaxID=2975950 RepID=UPI002DDB58E6|nr:hypothetical protein [Streptosporangium sp. NBC_01756]WSC83387.1 hypothetical protein OIE48_23575 [Streptosporangium sp. NBC_01756]